MTLELSNSTSSGRAVRKKIFQSERPPRELRLPLVNNKSNKKRGRKAKNVESSVAESDAPVDDIYAFVFDPESEPKIEKSKKTVRRKRPNQKDDLPQAKKRKRAEITSNEIVKIPNPPEKKSKEAGIISETIKKSGPSVGFEHVRASNASRSEDPMPPEPSGNIERDKTPNPSKNQSNTTRGILKTPNPSIPRLQSTPVSSGIQNFPESPGAEFVKKFQQRIAGSNTQKRVSFSTPFFVRNQNSAINASFINLSPMPIDSPQTANITSVAPLKMSSTPLHDNMPSPWRIDMFSPYRSNTLNSMTQSTKQTPVMPSQNRRNVQTQEQTGPLRDISNLPKLSSQKRNRLSLSKPSKRARTNNQVSRTDPCNFGFEDSDEQSTTDKSPESIPDKNVLHLHRSQVREFFSKLSAQKERRPASKRYVNDENAIPELPLFYDQTEPKPSVEELTDEKEIPYQLRKPRVNRCLSMSDSEEESVVRSPKKKSRADDRDVELESFAREFNSMCEEVEQYELVVEAKRD